MVHGKLPISFGLFAEITKNSVELSVAERIRLLIVEVINVIAALAKLKSITG